MTVQSGFDVELSEYRSAPFSPSVWARSDRRPGRSGVRGTRFRYSRYHSDAIRRGGGERAETGDLTERLGCRRNHRTGVRDGLGRDSAESGVVVAGVTGDDELVGYSVAFGATLPAGLATDGADADESDRPLSDALRTKTTEPLVRKPSPNGRTSSSSTTPRPMPRPVATR